MGCQEETAEESWSTGCTYENNNSTAKANVHSDPLNLSSKYSTGQISTQTNSDDCSKDSKANEWWYQNKRIDLTRFLRFHPGGTPSLKAMKGQNVEPAMKSTHHSSEAFYFLRDFYNGNAEEDLVDWKKPMLSQVGSLGPLYSSWVWSPVDKPLRLFQNEWLEKLTRTDWRQVISVWVPVITIALALSFHHAPPNLDLWVRAMSVIISTLLGMSVWPLLEYSIHRWVFHLQPPKNSSILITLHFGLHGLHHKVPFDEGRLLFPPGPCSVMAFSLYYIYTRILPWWIAMAFFGGTMLGYLIYDLIHYYLHHGSPKEGSYLYHMKRYHNQHHFAQQDIGFGISSDFWDHAFDTVIRLKKLAKPLSWES